jgi:hypothetical protein
MNWIITIFSFILRILVFACNSPILLENTPKLNVIIVIIIIIIIIKNLWLYSDTILI